MYYDRENWVSKTVGNTFIGYYGANSEYSKAIKELILSVWGICPPFSADICGNKFSGTFKINFFNEFDPRVITPEKMHALLDAMKASSEYEITEERVGSEMLIVSYRKKQTPNE